MKKIIFILFAICVAVSAYASCGVGKFKNASGNCEQCPAGLSTFDGADEIEDCGKVLHFGDDFIYLRQNKKTKPSLVVVVDGVEYYGNMTTNNASKLKINMDGTEYSVYDERMTPLEYLYFDGRSYIDLGFPPRRDLNFEVKALYDMSKPTDACLIGSRTSNGGQTQYVVWYNNWYGNTIDGLPQIVVRLFTDWDAATNVLSTITSEATIRWDNQIFSINDEIYDIDYFKYNVSNPYNLFLGGLNDYGRIDNRMFPGWIYYAKFWDSNGMIMDLVPVLDPTGVPCMYDKVSNRFLYNQGTGTFGYQISE